MRFNTTPIVLLLFACVAAFADGFVQPTLHQLKHKKGENDAVIGIVERVLGVPELRRGKEGRAQIGFGMRVFEKTLLSTDKKSRLHVRFKDGTYLEMGEETKFEVERIRFKPGDPIPVSRTADHFDETVFRFNQGLLRLTAADVHALEHFTIKTVNAIVRVSGPVDLYLVQLEGERDLTVRVARGKVEVINAVTNEKMEVPEGSGAYVKVSGLVSAAGKFTEEQLSFLKTRTRI